MIFIVFIDFIRFHMTLEHCIILCILLCICLTLKSLQNTHKIKTNNYETCILYYINIAVIPVRASGVSYPGRLM